MSVQEIIMQRVTAAFTILLFTLCAGAAAGVALAAGSPQQDPQQYFPEPVYVALQNSGAIEVLPQKTVWQGFPQAHYIAVGPQGRRLLISGFGTGQVYLADTKTGRKLGTLKIGELVQGVKIAPGGKLALAADTPGDSVKVIDLDTMKVTQTIPVGKSPHNIAFSRDGKIAYVTVQGANKLAVVDMVSFKKMRDIDVGGLNGPHNLDVSNNGRWVWIRSHASPTERGDVALVDLATQRILADIPVGLFHGGIDSVPGSPVLTTNIGEDTVDVIDRNGLGVLKRIKVGAQPHGVRMSSDGRWAYVTSTIDNEVDVIDVKTLKVVDKIKMEGSFPFWIALVGNS
jgi:YVTN family beta-propeller protein